LFAEQMKEIGLAVTPQIVTPAEFFDVKALGTADAVTFAIYSFPLQSIHTRTALFPSLAFNDPEYTAAVAAAISDPDEPQRVGAWREAQRLMHDRGNWVVWGFGDSLNLARDGVHGVEGRGLAKYPYLAKAWVA
jgi:peptide/nickel transport system substrate-binding protein